MNELITKIDFFAGLDEKILKKISDACIARQFTRNETIVRQGEMGLGLYVIARGHVKVDREEKGVRTQVAELGPEQFFGEMSLLDNKPRSATVTGIEDSECLLLTRDSFVKLMNKYPEIPIRMARVLAELLRVANEKLAAGPPAPAIAVAVAATAPAPAVVPPVLADPVVPTAPSSNGATPAAAEEGTKQQIRAKLLETFQSLYTLKALSRFSIAVLGCPVEGTAANMIDQIRVGDVKALIFPADEPVEMRIDAKESGCFVLDVFTPSNAVPQHFGPITINPSDPVQMTMLSKDIILRRGKNLVDFH